MSNARTRFDERLFALKLAEIARRMHQRIPAIHRQASAETRQKGGSCLMRIVGGEIALLREWMEEQDANCREVWQTQGEMLTPAFIREVLLPKAFQLLASRRGAVSHSITLLVQRTNRSENPQVALRYLSRQIRDLESDLNNRYEIEARELEYQKVPAAQKNGPQSQLDELGSIRGLITDATKDTALWLQANPSAEGQVHVLAIQERLANLARIIERRMECRSSPNDGGQWSENVAEVLSLLGKAGEVRGQIVGYGLARIPARLPEELPSPKRPRVKVPPPIKPVNTSWCGGLPDTREAEHPTKPEASTERADQSVLPPGLRGVGDPVDGNPFPRENPRYAHWQQATLKAEEELCLLNVQFMKNSPTRERFAEWMQRGGPFSAEREFAAWTLNFVAAKFDIWAKRACHVVWDEYDLKVFDKWLFDYAESWLRAERHAGRDAILPELRARLIEHMEFWKAAARGTLGELRRIDAENSDKTAHNERPNYQEQVAVARHSDTASPVQNNGKTTQKVGSKSTTATASNERESVVLRILDNNGWSIHRLAVEATVDFHTVNDYLKGRTRPNRSTRKQLADALGIAVDELPK